MIIELKNFGFTYAGADAHALSGITLDVNGGEFILICGKSGCGKTTLLRNLKKEIAPVGKTTGEIRICGLKELTPVQSATLVGFVMQDPDNQIVMDSVWLELAFGLENLGVPSEEIGRRIGEISAFFGIDSWFGKKVEELSGGQKQILSLAAVIAMQAEIIVLDEPTSQLDPIASKEFLNMLMRVNTELGKTVIISEHLLEDVFSMSDKVLYLESGRIKYFGDSRTFPSLFTAGDDYYPALPSAARLAARFGVSSVPLDVRDGRAWLLDYPGLRSLRSRYDITDQAALYTTNTNATSPGANATHNTTLEAQTATPHTTSTNAKDKHAPAIKATGLWFRYSKNDDFVIKGLDAEIAENTIHVFVGGNGSGKSTLLRLLAGIKKPFRGRVSRAKNASITMLSQDPKSVFVCETLKEEFADKNTYALTERLGLGELLERHPYDLSAGEMQKAALVKALMQEPDILLLDEPTKALDAFSRNEIGGILSELKREGKTIIIVTHDIEFAAMYGDRCAMLFAGGIIAEDFARNFFNNNMFYTTAVNRMTRGLIDNCILESDVVKK